MLAKDLKKLLYAENEVKVSYSTITRSLKSNCLYTITKKTTLNIKIELIKQKLTYIEVIEFTIFGKKNFNTIDIEIIEMAVSRYVLAFVLKALDVLAKLIYALIAQFTKKYYLMKCQKALHIAYTITLVVFII
ncbi:hypothetical protein RFI_27951 [Reticulomyxa filosa]|uniref:Uncharacterized protein n=1 Tax=Reticulomyxa filosa TaxID=46433 RepID=X6M6A6_RETFI|nr:hypothetical protein RFI_27951 [Reticulomyxa filosa]|eukprot:ETO09429.1 hypothetical protein RFI_27951 [Reticulomyxa filosa]